MKQGYSIFLEMDKDEQGNPIPIDEQYRTVIEKMSVPPTLCVESGGKSLHIYYTLTEPVEAKLWKELQHDFINFIPYADAAVKDISRVLRLIGFRYCKDDKNNFTKIYRTPSSKFYDYEELRRIIPKSKKNPYSTKKAAITTENSNLPLKDLAYKSLDKKTLEYWLNAEDTPNGEQSARAIAVVKQLAGHFLEGNISDKDGYNLIEDMVLRFVNYREDDPWTEDNADTFWEREKNNEDNEPNASVSEKLSLQERVKTVSKLNKTLNSSRIETEEAKQEREARETELASLLEEWLTPKFTEFVSEFNASFWGMFEASKYIFFRYCEEEVVKAGGKSFTRLKLEIDKISESEMAEVIRNTLGSELVVNQDQELFYLYNYPEKGIWNYLTKIEMKEIVNEFTRFFKRGFHNSFKEGTYSNLGTTRGVLKTLPETKSWLVPLQNGVLNLKTNEFRDFQKEDYLTYKLSFDYVPEANDESWLQQFDEIACHDKDTRELMLASIYAVVFGKANEKLYFENVGLNANNAKSTLLRLVIALLGEDNCAPIDPSLYSKNPYAFAWEVIHNKKFLYDDEAPETIDSCVSLKKITSATPMQINRKNAKQITSKIKAVFWMNTNHNTHYRQQDKGLSFRRIVVEYKAQFKKGENAVDILEMADDNKTFYGLWADKLPDIFNYLIKFGDDRFKAIIKKARNGEINSSKDLTLESVENSSSLGEWMLDHLTFNADHWVAKSKYKDDDGIREADVYGLYTNWCINKSHTPVNQKNFLTNLMVQADLLRFSVRKSTTMGTGVVRGLSLRGNDEKSLRKLYIERN